jgi:hypothetical protein
LGHLTYIFNSFQLIWKENEEDEQQFWNCVTPTMQIAKIRGLLLLNRASRSLVDSVKWCRLKEQGSVQIDLPVTELES